MPDLYRGPFEGNPQGYCLFTHFNLLEEGEGAPAAEPLRGLMSAIAEYGVPGGEEPAAMTIAFKWVGVGGCGGKALWG